MSAAINETSQTEEYVSVNGIKIHYETFGSGKSLLFLHGAMATGQVWRPYVPILSNDFNCIGKNYSPNCRLR